MHAESDDQNLGGLTEINADATEATITLQPVASATAKLVDEKGEALADRQITYGVRVHLGDKNAPFRWSWGGVVMTDAEGKFSLARLVPGATYEVNVAQEMGRSRTVGKTTPPNGESIDLGELKLEPYVEYKPPTLEERIASAFTSKLSPLERFQAAQRDAKLTRQSIAIVLADPASKPAKEFMSLRFEDDDVRSAFDEFRIIAVNVSPDHVTAANELSERISDTAGIDSAVLRLLIVDEMGRLTAATTSGELSEAESLSREKLLSFLKQHTQPPLVAETLLKDALVRAKAENKRVIVQETATWCGPCLLLSRFLDRHRDVWEPDYIWIKLDHRWTGARELMKEMRREADGGIPWWAILDADGKPLATSNMPTGDNIGFPASHDEIQHFETMVKGTAQRMTAEQLRTLVDDLKKKK
jgi:hypothetical protein